MFSGQSCLLTFCPPRKLVLILSHVSVISRPWWPSPSVFVFAAASCHVTTRFSLSLVDARDFRQKFRFSTWASGGWGKMVLFALCTSPYSVNLPHSSRSADLQYVRSERTFSWSIPCSDRPSHKCSVELTGHFTELLEMGLPFQNVQSYVAHVWTFFGTQKDSLCF